MRTGLPDEYWLADDARLATAVQLLTAEEGDEGRVVDGG